MNIDLLSKMVKELILENDRVVLPGLGVFVAEVVPASFSDKGYTLNPPYRRLHFRMHDGQDDALVNLYVAANAVSVEMARDVVIGFVSELKHVLQKNKVVIFPGLGRLRATKENNFFFVPDADLDIYPEGFGLEPISLKTHQETAEDMNAVMENLTGIMNETVAPEKPAFETGPAEVPAAEPEIVVGPEPVVESEPAGEPESLGESGPAEEPESVMEEETGVADVPEADVPETETDSDVACAADPAAERKRTVRTVLVVAGIVAGVLVLALLVFLVLADACPEFIDSVLYNEEELEIIRNFDNI